MLGVAGIGSLFSGTADATGEDLLVMVPELPVGAKLGDLPQIELVAASTSLLYVSVRSTLESGNHIVDESEDIEAGVLPQRGKGLYLDNPHQLSLSSGYYAQKLTISAWDAMLDEVVVRSALRFFYIQDGKLEVVTSAEYSDVVDPLVAVLDEHGRPGFAQAGTGRGIVPKLPEVLQFAVPQRLEGGAQ